jgi:hypothetical protein
MENEFKVNKVRKQRKIIKMHDQIVKKKKEALARKEIESYRNVDLK